MHGNITYTNSECSMEKRKRCSEVMCDRRMPVKLKGNVYKTVHDQTISVIWCRYLSNITSRGQYAQTRSKEIIGCCDGCAE